jgi:hypothetical protein
VGTVAVREMAKARGVLGNLAEELALEGGLQPNQHVMGEEEKLAGKGTKQAMALGTAKHCLGVSGVRTRCIA